MNCPNCQQHPLDCRCEGSVEALKADCARLRAEVERLKALVCTHGWRGHKPERGERIVTPCPTCGLQTLFIGNGGHITCGSVPGSDGSGGCQNPDPGEVWKAAVRRAELAEAKIEAVNSALGLHPDSDTDFAQAISDIRSECRAHFNSVTKLGEKLQQAEADCVKLARKLAWTDMLSRVMNAMVNSAKEGDVEACKRMVPDYYEALVRMNEIDASGALERWGGKQ